ncbi:N-acetylneuraminic acid synthetase [Paramagnetospirillum caucaseum]|uniref:N-acetylneuraminic acid synthetase n=1 Tax=Paramagnetospirillum caucaseum TaxID=1244869 RepID=M3A9X9_9PROT|nr:N-acetylneuraminate synthase [Paramagnetospirillum caucaseum]EME69314.1 N-acetylneuraminic acid synthetase [Paramagnetospirillum caucaseum]
MGVFIIAEAGVNHNGDPALALELIDAAARAGADAVKFQTFEPEALATGAAGKAEYQKVTTGSGESQLDMLRRLVLPKECYPALQERCRSRGIRFLSTPFDLGSLRFLVDEVGIDLLKLSSGAVVHGPLLLAAARTGLPIILSTGMSTMGEIEGALAVLAFGVTQPVGNPSQDVLASRDLAPLAGRVTLLHCTTEYPAPLDQVNLRAMDGLAAHFGLPVGYSDHTQGITVTVAAAARGAMVVEKHFTLDRALPGPDHKASLEPDELAAMVGAIREVEQALGVAEKAPTPAELQVAKVARASLVAARPIAAGTVLTEADLAVKRPGTGLSPLLYWHMLGRVAGHGYRTDELIDP